MLPLQQIKPKTARSKRALQAREPLETENPKTVLFLRGTSSSSLLNSLLTDLHTLKRPHAIRFTKKNPIHPFADASSLEFFSQKNDAALLLLASHSKKRPHALTFTRCFGGAVLDMLELLVQPETARTLAQFKGEKCTTGVKPLLSFTGARFESPTPDAYTLAKSMFLDFFRGGETPSVDVEGLQLLISFFAGEDEGEVRGGIQMRCWKIVTKRSGAGGKVPKVEVVEIGPRIDFRVGRVREADPGVMKEALKRATGTQPKSKKNVETDTVGDKVGRIHLGRQDLSELQTRKMKGLKRNRAFDYEEEQNGGGKGEGDDGDGDVVSDGADGDGEEDEEEEEEEGGVPLTKKSRLA